MPRPRPRRISGSGRRENGWHNPLSLCYPPDTGSLTPSRSRMSGGNCGGRHTLRPPLPSLPSAFPRPLSRALVIPLNPHGWSLMSTPAPAESPPPPTTLDRLETNVDQSAEFDRLCRYDHYLRHPRPSAFATAGATRARILAGLAEHHTPETHAAALRMRECLAWPSIWIDADGGLHPVLGRCKHRLCPYCAQHRATTVQDRVLATIAEWDSVRHVVLTIRSSDAPLAAQLDHLLASYRRLRQTVVWRETSTAAMATVEITHNPNTGQWHPHLHVLATGSYIPHAELRSAWATATQGSTIIYLSRVDSRRAAARYISKYVAKPAEIADLPPASLAEYLAATRGRRLLIATGGAHNTRLTRPPDDAKPKLVREVASWHHLQRAYAARRPYAITLIDRVQSAWPSIVQHVRYADAGLPAEPPAQDPYQTTDTATLIDACRTWCETGVDPPSVTPHTPPPRPPPLLWPEDTTTTAAAIRES